jgi:hypothetical protein
MPTKAPHKKHTAKASVQIHGLAKAGTSIELELFADEERPGTLKIGRGSFMWYGANCKKARRFTWSDFAAKMEQ